MLKDYAKRNGFLNCQFYVDDGYSGTALLIRSVRHGGYLLLAAASKRTCENTSAVRRLFSFTVVRQNNFYL